MGMTIRIDDMIIAVAYFSIPLQLVASLTYYPRLMQMPLKILLVVILFALFVWCCGFGHFLRAAGYTNKTVFEVVNWITAIVSLLTALVFLPMVPTVMSELDEGLSRLQQIDEEFAKVNAEAKLALTDAVKDTTTKKNKAPSVAPPTTTDRSSTVTAATARTSTISRTSTMGSTARTEDDPGMIGSSSGRRSTTRGRRVAPFSSKNNEYQNVPTTVHSSSSEDIFNNEDSDSSQDIQTVSWV